MRLRHPLAATSVLLALLFGCTSEDNVGAKLPTGRIADTPTPGTTASGNPTPTPSPTPSGTASPSPTPSASPSSLTSGIDSSAPPASVDTLPTQAPTPSPTPTPLGAVVSTLSLTDAMRDLACPSRSSTLWLLGAGDVYALAGGSAPQGQGLSVPASPSTFRFGPDGDLWVAGGTSLGHYVPQLMGWDVQTIGLPGTALDLAVDGTEAWVVTATGVSRVRASDLHRTDLAVTAPTAIALDGSNAWVTSAGNDTLYQITRSSGTTARTYPTGSSPRRVALDSAGGVWIANQSDSSLTYVSAVGATPAQVSLTGSPNCLWADGTTLWVGQANAKAVRVTALGIQGTTPLPFAPARATIDASGRVWFLDGSGRSLVALKGR